MPASFAVPPPLLRPAFPSPLHHARAARKRKRPRSCPVCQHPPRAQPRPDASVHDPHALPQTIEHALLLSQHATQAALEAASTRAEARLAVELPMGRSRRFWYRMSPPIMVVAESATLALHYAQLFRGLRLAVVLGHGAASAQRVDWVDAIIALDDLHDDTEQLVRNAQVVIIAAATKPQRSLVDRVVALAERAEGVFLFNCFLDVPLSQVLPPDFRYAYVCRALDKVAVLMEEPGIQWEVFVEIAVFEYEWVGPVPADAWLPSQETIERFSMARGAQRKGISGYYETTFSGCEAGFWPFMTIACESVAPMDGKLLAVAQQKKAEKRKTSKRPFGFF